MIRPAARALHCRAYSNISKTETKWGMNVGNTPVIDLAPLLPEGALAPGVRVLGKCEFANPSGSIKDRIVQVRLRPTPFPPTDFTCGCSTSWATLRGRAKSNLG